MICPKCGSEIKDGAKFCKYCGAAIVATGSANQKPAETTKPTVTTKAPVVKKPGVATVKKATKKKKATTANVTVSKVKKAVGYQIKISTSKKFTKKTTKTVESKKTKITVKKLKKNKQYYAKVRAYVLKSNKTKLYGNWSKVVKVKNTK